MNDPSSRDQPSVADLVARFDKPATTTVPSARTSPLRQPSGRVRQLAGAYEAQLRALLKQLEEERARRQRQHAHSTRTSVDSNASLPEEDAALEAALHDVQRLLAAHCATHAVPRTVDDASEGPGTPDPLNEPTPLEPSSQHPCVSPAPDASLHATEQRVQDLLQRLHAHSSAGSVTQPWWGGVRALELQPEPTVFDPLTANSMYADPLRQAAFPLTHHHDSDDD